MHRELHRSHQLSSPSHPHFLPRRSSSASPEKPALQSPHKASAALHTANVNGISPTKQQQSHSVKTEADGADKLVHKPAVKRKLLHSAAADGSSEQSNWPQHQQPPLMANGKHMGKPKHQKGRLGSSLTPAVQSSAEAALLNGRKLANGRLAGSNAGNGTAALDSKHATSQQQGQQQQQQQDLGLQSNGFRQSADRQQQQQQAVNLQSGALWQAKPASVKEFLQGAQQGQLAPWDDVDPDLAKHAAALSR